MKKEKNNRGIQQGDVYWAYLTGDEHEQQGKRPCLVCQNNRGNTYSPNVVVYPLTSKRKKNLPTHVFLPADETGLSEDSIVLCENPASISKSKLGDYVTSLPDKYMAQVAAATLLASSLISFLDFDTLFTIRKQAIKLNNYK